jgi:hypothetical protein
MRFGSLAQILTKARLALETKYEDQKPVKVKHTQELDFLQSLCVLIPADLLFSTNLHYPPLLSLRVWWHKTNPTAYLLQRNSDLERTADRVLYWFDRELPTRTEANKEDVALLLELKGFFVLLKSKSGEMVAALRNRQMESAGDGVCGGGSCWDAVWETAFYLYFYLFLLHFPTAQPIDSTIELQQRYEGPYGEGGARRFYCLTPCEDKGKDGGSQSGGSSSCCSTCHCDDCCRCCSDCCWYYTTPSYSSHHHHHHHHHHSPYYSGTDSQRHNDPCCHECLVSTGLFDAWLDCCQFLCRGLFSCFKWIGDCHCAGCELKGLGQCCEVCRGCSSSVGDELASAFASFCGAVGALVAFILDAISSHGTTSDDSGEGQPTNSTNSSAARYLFEEAELEGSDLHHRRLDAQTSSEYLPSIIFMTIALFIFLPRLLANVFYSLVNLSQGISGNHSVKAFAAMLLGGLPFGLLLSILGGASRWTFVTLLLITMHAAYAVYSLQRKKVDPRLMDVSFLTCAEWREYRLDRDGLYLREITASLVRLQDTFQTERKKIQEQRRLLRSLRRILWPTIDKAYLRWVLRDLIKASHRLDSESLHKKYQPEGGPTVEAIPVAVLVNC